MKRLIPTIAIIMILIPIGGTADEIMLVGGQLDYVGSYNDDDGLIRPTDFGSFLGVTATVRGSVKCSIGYFPIDGAMIRSTGVGATVSVNGQYLLSEVPGTWTLTASKQGFLPVSKTLRIDTVDQQLVINFTMCCYDADHDLLCDFEDPSQDMDADGVLDGYDNCPTTPNGAQAGTCMWGSRKGLTCYSIHGCGCSSSANYGCELFQYDVDGEGMVCSHSCMDSPDPDACKYLLDDFFDHIFQ